MTKHSDYFTGEPVKKGFTAGSGPSPSAAAEQELKGKELGYERSLKTEELLKERELKITQLTAALAASQKKVKELLEAVRYRDRKISKLGPGATVGRVIGSNVMDHSKLGIAEVPEEAKAVPALKSTLTKSAPKR